MVWLVRATDWMRETYSEKNKRGIEWKSMLQIKQFDHHFRTVDFRLSLGHPSCDTWRVLGRRFDLETQTLGPSTHTLYFYLMSVDDCLWECA